MFFDFKQLTVDVLTKSKELSNSFNELILLCSGGPDSTLLFHVFCELVNHEKFFKKFRVVHFNYQLRSTDSDEDEDFVKGLCLKYGIEVEIHHVDGKAFIEKSGNSKIQEWARDIRRNFIQNCSHRTLIATAHHRDDLAENILMRISRGCGPLNSMGMKVLDGNLWKPFLTINKENISHVLSAQRLSYRHDKSNDTMNYTRNRVRNIVLKELNDLYPGASERIINFMELTSELLKPLAELDAQELNADDLRGLQPAVANLKLHRFLSNKIGRGVHISKQSVQASLKWICDQERDCSNKFINLRKGWVLQIKKGGQLEIFKQ